MKHRIKGWLREAWARLLYHGGLWRLVDRLSAPRLLILAGHCVDDPAVNGGLPADMKISPGRLEEILRRLGRRYRLVSVGEGLAALRSGQERRSLVALSMDDGYRDNRTALLALLGRAGARATVFLESLPLEERRVTWLHKWFWIVERTSAEEASRALLGHLQSEELRRRVEAVLARGEKVAYSVKRLFKYEARAGDRDAALDALFEELGGDEGALCERIHLDWEDVRVLAASGRVELGGHTVTHPVLATLDGEEQGREVALGRQALVRELGNEAGRVFAYPYGRAWDYDERSVRAVQEAGFEAAVTTHAGAVRADCDPCRLPRWMIDEHTPLHHLVTEACGGFELWRRLGIDLVE